MKKLGLIIIPLFISSCSYIYGDRGVIQNRATDYLKAESIAPLRVPADLSSDTIHETYPVATKQHYLDGKKEVSLIPPEL